MLIAKFYFAAVAVMSVITFSMFGLDKRNAKMKPSARIPEKHLHLAALLGGWPGALLGQQFFRHKTIKISFRVVLWLIVMLHLAVIGCWFYFRSG